MANQDGNVEKSPQILTYACAPAKDRRAEIVVTGFCLGMLFAGIAWTFVGFIAATTIAGEVTAQLAGGVVASIMLNFVCLVPATLAVVITIYVKRWVFKEVRYRRFRTGIICGLIAGSYPLLISLWLGLSEKIFLGGMLWFLLFPAAMATFLCYHSHVRD